MKSSLEETAQKIESKNFTVGVVGLGYVGLPLCRTFLSAGVNVIGYDTDRLKVEHLAQGESYINHIGSEWIRSGVSSGTFRPSGDAATLADADAILICVPTPLTDSNDPDLSYVESTATEIARHLRSGQLVVLESTTYPGTSRQVVLPILEASGLVPGIDFALCYSPEREDPGNSDYSTASIPKVVGGYCALSVAIGEALYRSAVDTVIPVASLEIAEACKLLENTYRAVNIALVNELKGVFGAVGIDIWDVLDASATKPFGFQRFDPGPGLGGHCIPIDPFYLSWLARRAGVPTKFIELAGEINSAMPSRVVEKVARAINMAGKSTLGAEVCVLGVAYKKNIDDPRESPGIEVLEQLMAIGCVVSYHDPHIPSLPKMRHHQLPDMASVSLTPALLQSLDAVVIVTDHDLIRWDLVAEQASLIVDTRNAIQGPVFGELVRA
jgi:UDP-N-acetyl-D-glucosamine dehydrogenase